ncbi:hypothetical protein JX265_011043 [Neoarthrinium moseri]|uniref:Uncharacterized protein n=1 Tax=Neoarthrinium moseri TaxID=1658444 RepID=A0A9P9WCZ6_9PEZI|nr:uncharacterized protein JN550_005024 [Neoarthrinium moseri]KAI1852410.1 hypothetical protein JX266_002588 [Neoarthrinium moseri]KAI1857628.1 hypothetical protein JX265_011043 [Neoarthrinium moseri]KAI1870481.1 hypothetical protein JN550_005024 [Neoarthrinium moseri]
MASTEGVSSTETCVKKFEAPEKPTANLTRDESHDSYTTCSTTYDADILDEFADMDEDCLVADATMVGTEEPKMQIAAAEPPALPQKSSLRASRILDSLKLSSIESATQSLNTRHDVYLSSEEDGSSSADDFSDYDWESSSEGSEKSHMRRKSYEDTARVVSVIYSGKPCIVDLPSPRRSTSPSTTEGSDSESGSSSSPSTSSVSVESRPPRTSSLAQSNQPAFLRDDPYAGSQYTMGLSQEERLDGTSRASKPTTMKTTVQRTFSIVRKRSRPFLRNYSTVSREDLALAASSSSLNLSRISTPTTEQAPILDSPVRSAEPPRTPVRYSDIIKTSRKLATTRNDSVASLPAITPLSPLSKKSLFSGLKSSRRRSFKA